MGVQAFEREGLPAVPIRNENDSGFIAAEGKTFRAKAKFKITHYGTAEAVPSRSDRALTRICCQ
jgi:hypothetical protein